MSIYSISANEKKEAIKEFYRSHAMTSLKTVDKKIDVSEISVAKFASYLGVTLTRDQQIACALVYRQPVTTVVSAHATGKSLLSSILILYETICRRGLGVSTAPTSRQVKQVLFRYVNQYFNVLKNNPKFFIDTGIDLKNKYSIGHTFLRELDVEEIKRSGTNFWFEEIANPRIVGEDELENFSFDNQKLGSCFGQTSRTSDGFQGIHAERMLIVLDEASGIPEEITDAVLSCAAGADNHVFSVGNPINRNGAFIKWAKERGCFQMTPFTHPNCEPYYEQNAQGRWILVDDTPLEPGWLPYIQGAVTPSWVEMVREKYGEQSLYWVTRVLARFPKLGDMAGAMFLQENMDRSRIPINFPANVIDSWNYLPLYVGVDVGESGDPTVITMGHYLPSILSPDQKRRGEADRPMFVIRSILEIPSEGEDHIQQERNFLAMDEAIKGIIALSAIGGRHVFICTDNTGIGVSLTKDIVTRTEYTALPIHFASRAKKSKQFKNVRAEIFWILKTRFEKGEMCMYASIPDKEVQQTFFELEGVRYELAIDERIQIIPKEIIEEILGCSPNHADSLGLMVYGGMHFEEAEDDEVPDSNDLPDR